MSNTIYISGSISDGDTLGPEDRAKRIEMFSYAEELLTEAGFEVLNPARHGSVPEFTWLDYMRLSLLDIAKADVIATLPGWEASAGAQVEVTLARGLGLPIAGYDQWVTLLRPDIPVEPPVESPEEPVDPEPEPQSPDEADRPAPLPTSEAVEAGEPQ